MSADTIVNAAQLAWDIIKDGAPSSEISSSTANAVPEVSDWQSLSDARGPNSYRMHYHVDYVWPLDDYEHVDFTILLKWDIGARYHGGGAFIPNIWVEVPECFVGFGWHADIRLTAQHPTNAGSTSAPMARIPVTVAGTVHSGAESYHVEWGFVLFGDGTSTTG